jgi:hypothetical protein
MTARVVYKPQVPADIQWIVIYLDEYSIAAGDRFLARLATGRSSASYCNA